MIFPIMNQRIGNPNMNNCSQNLQYDLRISRKSVSTPRLLLFNDIVFIFDIRTYFFSRKGAKCRKASA